MIQFEKLTKKYKNKKILNEATIEFPNTGLVAITGESGVGKTTLLHMLSGIENKTSGLILYDGTSKKLMRSYRKKNISNIFQDYLLLSDHTVYENLSLYLKMHGLCDDTEISSRISQVLKLLKINKYKNHRVDSLSGGEQQRVAIARILLIKKKIILADEPTSNLDYENANLVLRILKEVSKEALVIFVTHTKSLALSYADFIYEMKMGSITLMNKEAISIDKSMDLEELSKEDISSKNLSAKLYGVKETIELKIYQVNGNFYYESNVPLEKVEKSQFSILEDMPRMKNEPISLPTFSSSQRKNKIILDRKPTKLYKLNRYFLSILSIFVFLASFFVVLSTTKDDASIRYNQNAYVMNKRVSNDGTENYLSKTNFCDLLVENTITDIAENKNINLYLFYNSYVVEKKFNCVYLPLCYNSSECLYGTLSLENEDEIVISKILADEIRGDIPMMQLLNYSLTVGETNHRSKIVGITNSTAYEAFYLKEKENLDFVEKDVPILEGESEKAYISSVNDTGKFTITDGSFPASKDQVLVLDDGKMSIGDKCGIYLVCGLFETSSDFTMVIRPDGVDYFQDIIHVNNIYNQNVKDRYIFQYHSDKSYINLYTQRDYQVDTLYKEKMDNLKYYFVPNFIILSIQVIYILGISILINKQNIKLFTHERIEGRRISLICINEIYCSLKEILYEVIPYLLLGGLTQYASSILNGMELGFTIPNLLSNLWYWMILLGIILSYIFIRLFVSFTTLFTKISKLLKQWNS